MHDVPAEIKFLRGLGVKRISGNFDKNSSTSRPLFSTFSSSGAKFYGAENLVDPLWKQDALFPNSLEKSGSILYRNIMHFYKSG